jgi:V8-like Glu-specific endopeptidase
MGVVSQLLIACFVVATSLAGVIKTSKGVSALSQASTELGWPRNLSTTFGPSAVSYNVPKKTHIGLLFFFHGQTFDRVCTGSIVTSDTRSIVATAAHCLHDDRGVEADRIVFAPEWAGEARPSVYFVSSGWRASPRYRQGYTDHDVAFIKFRPRFGKYLQDIYGSRSAIFEGAGQLNDLKLTAYGYNPITREEPNPLLQCVGISEVVRPFNSREFMLVLPDCDAKGGSSGGPVYHGANEFMIATISAYYRLTDHGRFAAALSPFGQDEADTLKDVELRG